MREFYALLAGAYLVGGWRLMRSPAVYLPGLNRMPKAAAEPQKSRLKIDNPAAAMMALEDEIRKEKEKLTPKELFRD